MFQFFSLVFSKQTVLSMYFKLKFHSDGFVFPSGFYLTTRSSVWIVTTVWSPAFPPSHALKIFLPLLSMLGAWTQSRLAQYRRENLPASVKEVCVKTYIDYSRYLVIPRRTRYSNYYCGCPICIPNNWIEVNIVCLFFFYGSWWRWKGPIKK